MRIFEQQGFSGRTVARAAALLLALGWGIPQASAKDFYLTVRRDASMSEKAELEVVYHPSDRALELRILKPTDVEGFLASQSDVRRAWKEPSSRLNPLKFLFAGWNAAQNRREQAGFSDAWIRKGADAAFRKEMVKSFHGGADSPESWKAPRATGRIIDTPPGFELVTSFWVEPEKEDAGRGYSVPGFDEWFDESSRYKTRVIPLPSLPQGLYVIQAMQEELEGQVILPVNDLRVQFQQSTDFGLWRVSDRRGRAVAGARVRARNLQGAWVVDGKTNEQGEFSLSNLKERELVSWVEAADRGVALVDSDFFTASFSSEDVFIYSDRPLYRPGDEIQFRGILRRSSAGKAGLVALPKSAVKVSLEQVKERSRRSREKEEETTPSNEAVSLNVGPYGTFAGRLAVPASAEEGVYRIRAEHGGRSHEALVRARHYVKPSYYLEVESPQETLRAGATLRFSVQAKEYAGGSPKISKASVELYRLRYEAPQWAEDAGMGESGSDVNYFGDRSGGKKAIVPVRVARLEKLEFSASGKASGEIQIPKELPGAPNFDYQFQLRIVTTSEQDEVVASSKTFLDLRSEVLASARFERVLEDLAAPVAPRLLVFSRRASGKPFPGRKAEVKFRWVNTVGVETPLGAQEVRTDERGVARVALPAGVGGGELLASVSMKDDQGGESGAEASLLVAGTALATGVVRVSELRMESLSSVLRVGEKLRLLTMLPQAWGEDAKDSGLLHVTVAGSQVFKTFTMPVKGLAHWVELPVLAHYGNAFSVSLSYSDPEQGWVERRASFTVDRPERRLAVAIQPKKEVVTPKATQELTLRLKDHLGKPVVGEVSLSVVDRAVLDLQPEFRPSLLEFFYPREKLNLATFLSSQFQGYGYSEKIAQLFRPNHQLAASKEKAVEFEDQADTAYWSAQLKTNARGELTVKFPLPANQTRWRVTAVALDTQGRFGEATAEFESVLDVRLLTVAPSFLRKGDRARVVLDAKATTLKSETPLKLELRPLDATLRVEAEPKVLEGVLRPGQSLSLEGRLEAAALPTSSSLQTFGALMEQGGGSFPVKQTVRVLPESPPVKEFYRSESQSKRLVLGGFQSNPAVSGVVYLSSPEVAAIASILDEYATYPWGCVEQQTAKALALRAFGGGARTKVREVLSASLKDGALRWYPNTEADPEITLWVLLELAAYGREQLESFDYGLMEIVGKLESSAEERFKDLSSSRALAATWARFRLRGQLWNEQRRKARQESDRPVLATLIEHFGNSTSALENAWLAEILEDREEFKAVRERSLERVQKAWDSWANRSTRASAAESFGWQECGRAGWLPNGWDSYPGRCLSGPALAARILGIADAEIRPALRLAEHRRGMGWLSTFETTFTLGTLHRSIQNWQAASRAALSKSPTAIGVTLDGKALALPGGNSADAGLRLPLPIEVLNQPGKHTLAWNASGLTAGLVELQRAVPLAEQKAVAGGFSLSRKVSRLSADGKREELKEGDPVQTGDLLWIEYRVQAAATQGLRAFFGGLVSTLGRSPFEGRYYWLQDAVPAGFEPVEEDQTFRASPYSLPLAGRYAERLVGSDKVSWTFSFSKGWMERFEPVGYVARVRHAGSFAWPPAVFEDFYAPEFTSRTAGTRIEVRRDAAAR